MSSLSDGMFVLHMPCDDNKQKVQYDTTLDVFKYAAVQPVLIQLCLPQADAVLHCSHVIEVVTKLAMMASKTDYVNINPGR